MFPNHRGSRIYKSGDRLLRNLGELDIFTRFAKTLSFDNSGVQELSRSPVTSAGSCDLVDSGKVCTTRLGRVKQVEEGVVCRGMCEIKLRWQWFVCS